MPKNEPNSTMPTMQGIARNQAAFGSCKTMKHSAPLTAVKKPDCNIPRMGWLSFLLIIIALEHGQFMISTLGSIALARPILAVYKSARARRTVRGQTRRQRECFGTRENRPTCACQNQPTMAHANCLSTHSSSRPGAPSPSSSLGRIERSEPGDDDGEGAPAISHAVQFSRADPWHFSRASKGNAEYSGMSALPTAPFFRIDAFGADMIGDAIEPEINNNY